MRRFGHTLKFVVFALIPLAALLVAAEMTVRVKYFLAHGYEWSYLTVPFGTGRFSLKGAEAREADKGKVSPAEQVRVSIPAPASNPQTAPAKSLAASSPTTTSPAVTDAPSDPAAHQSAPETSPSGAATGPTRSAPTLPAAGSSQPAPADGHTASGTATPIDIQREVDVDREFVWPPQKVNGQIRINWVKPCTSRVVYSSERHAKMARTFDDNCFRGDHVTQKKDADEYRIVFLGGSTVEDAQSDEEMMTAQFKRAAPPVFRGKRVRVVNAGKVGFESFRISEYWYSWVHKFSPDLVLYYEAWNEQTGDPRWLEVDQRLAAMRSGIHERLYNRSMLYTYVVEKFAFARVVDSHFWKIDVDKLRLYFTRLRSHVRDDGSRLVFVTQTMNWPRRWKGVDTFDYRAADGLIDRLKADPHYPYDVQEISALNQRLAVAYTIGLCQKLDVPVVNILPAIEAIDEAERASLFLDLGHLTVKGDRVVGQMIAAGLNWQNEAGERQRTETKH